MSRLRSHSTVGNVAIGGAGCLGACVLIFFWLVAIVIQLCIYGGIAAALFAGAYWLCTGEFCFAPEVVDPSVVVDQANGASNR